MFALIRVQFYVIVYEANHTRCILSDHPLKNNQLLHDIRKNARKIHMKQSTIARFI